jgi:hypothetical protein
MIKKKTGFESCEINENPIVGNVRLHALEVETFFQHSLTWFKWQIK